MMTVTALLTVAGERATGKPPFDACMIDEMIEHKEKEKKNESLC